MNQIKSKLRSSILSATAFISLFSLITQPIYAQKISLNTAFWNKIFKPIKDPEPPIEPKIGGSRPGEAIPICLISPDVPTQTRIIWNTKPFFLWKGDVKKIAVGIPGSQEYLTTQIVTGKQNINYTGQPLEPGKTYRLFIFLSELKNASPTKFIPFKIMEAPQRNRIDGELKLLERLEKNQGANSETIAQKKAEYFADKGLWMDTLQQAYSVPNPSPELSQILKDIPNQLCK